MLSQILTERISWPGRILITVFSLLYFLVLSSFNPNPFEIPIDLQPLEIIAQPIQKSRLRYRSDYERNPTRRGVIRSENNPNHNRPTIRVRSFFLN